MANKGVAGPERASHTQDQLLAFYNEWLQSKGSMEARRPDEHRLRQAALGLSATRRTREVQQMEFETWMFKVDNECYKIASVSVHDLADMPFMDWYNDEYTPREAAEEALRQEGFYAAKRSRAREVVDVDRVVPGAKVEYKKDGEVRWGHVTEKDQAGHGVYVSPAVEPGSTQTDFVLYEDIIQILAARARRTRETLPGWTGGAARRRSREVMTGRELWDHMIAPLGPGVNRIFVKYGVDEWTKFVQGFESQAGFDKLPAGMRTMPAGDIARALHEYSQSLTARMQAVASRRGKRRLRTQAGGMNAIEFMTKVGIDSTPEGQEFDMWLESIKGEQTLSALESEAEWQTLYDEFKRDVWTEAVCLFDIPPNNSSLLVACVGVAHELAEELGGPFTLLKEGETPQIGRGRAAIPYALVQSQAGEVFRLSLRGVKLQVDDVHETQRYDVVLEDGTVLDTLPAHSMTAARREAGESLHDERRAAYYDWESDGHRVMPSGTPSLEEAFSWAGEGLIDLATRDDVRPPMEDEALANITALVTALEAEDEEPGQDI